MAVYVILPAAGRSRRMGVAKLLIRWGDCLVIEHVLDAVRRHPAVSRVGVLCRADDRELQQAVSGCSGVELVVPAAEPEEMRNSVECLVEAMRDSESPGWMLIPADHPVIEVDVLDRLIHAWMQEPEKIAVPVHDGQRGHPTIFPASFPEEIKQIPAGKGINWLSRCAAPEDVQEVPCPEVSVLFDLDTPEDLARLQRQFKTHNGRQESGGH